MGSLEFFLFRIFPGVFFPSVQNFLRFLRIPLRISVRIPFSWQMFSPSAIVLGQIPPPPSIPHLGDHPLVARRLTPNPCKPVSRRSVGVKAPHVSLLSPGTCPSCLGNLCRSGLPMSLPWCRPRLSHPPGDVSVGFRPPPLPIETLGGLKLLDSKKPVAAPGLPTRNHD